MRARVVVAAIAAEFGLSAEALAARDRTPPVVAARWCASRVLYNAGWTQAQLARYWGLNHSTVVHMIRTIEQRPELMAVVARYDLMRSAAYLTRAVASIGQPDAGYVSLYLQALLEERAWQMPALVGLHILCRRQDAYNVAVEALSAVDAGHHLWRIRAQAHQAGYDWRWGT